jgi:ParB family chromosome partitioning protein
LDDHDLVMAQGQENTSRQDLSFIEKASFAAQLAAMDYERQTIAAALSVDLPMLSRLLKVGTAFDLPFLKKIGSAPSIGRDRWMALADALHDPAARARVGRVMNRPDYTSMNSDTRFEAVMAGTAAPAPTRQAPDPRPKPRTLRSTDGKALAELRVTGRGVTLSIPARTADGFDAWISDNAEALLTDLHDRWKKQSEDR